VLKEVLALAVALSLVVYVPVYEYGVYVTIGSYTLFCDVLVTGDGRIAESACYLTRSAGVSYVNPHLLRIPGTSATLAEVISAAIHPGQEKGEVEVHVSRYTFDVKYVLIASEKVGMLTAEGTSILAFIAVIVVVGATYTLLFRRKYSVW